ncbi:hypothetical protein P7L78_21920 [Tistrella bauzanensis]|uniref:hypothetical protein n=1 Tax=Tistrella TaxID=171436 RepID=UPI0031F64F53
MPAAIPVIVAAGQAIIAAAGAELLGSALVLTVEQALLASTALSIAGAIATKLLAPDPPRAQLQAGTQVSRQTLAPRTYAVGRVRLGGVPVYSNTGEAGHPHRSALIAAVVHAAIQMTAIEAVWLGDKPVTVTAETGKVPDEPWSNRITVETHLGTAGQTASPLLLEASPTEWTAAHRLSGLAYSVAAYRPGTAETHYQIYDQGPPPVTIVGKTARVYDPRDPAQDVDDPSTWVWSDNAALVILYYLIGRDEHGLPVGYGLPPARIDMASFAAAADVCDDAIPLKAGGTEPRWRLAGTWTSDAKKADVLDKMRACCGGRLDTGPDGRQRLTVGGQAPVDVPVLTDDHIWSLDLAPGSPLIDRINEVRASYPSEAADWSVVDAAPQRDLDAQARDGVEPTEITLDFCPSEGQAQRLAKAHLRTQRPVYSGEITADLLGYDVVGSQWVRLTLTEHQTDLVYEVLDHEYLDTDQGIKIVVAAYDDPWAWDAETDEADPDPMPVALDRDPVAAPEAPDVVVQSRVVDGVTRAAVAVVSWPARDDDELTIQVRWRKIGADGWQSTVAATGETSIEISPLEDGAEYEGQIRWMSAVGIASDWSPSTTVLAVADQVAPAAPVLTLALTGGSLDQILMTTAIPDDDHAYRLIIERDTDAGFSGPVTAAGPRVILPGETVVILGDALGDGSYYLRARLTNRSGVTGDWSDVEDVTIDTGGGP